VREEIRQANGIYKVIGYDALYNIAYLEEDYDVVAQTKQSSLT
jgi:hypothetical protein